MKVIKHHHSPNQFSRSNLLKNRLAFVHKSHRNFFFPVLFLLFTCQSLVSFSQSKNSQGYNPTKITEPTFAKGQKVSGGNFSGDVWVNSLTSITMQSYKTSIGNVTFAPKSRTKWHVHPSGQILLVTDGVGYYQEKGQPVKLMRKGDVITCPKNIPHWHGAAPDSYVTHVTVGFDDGKGRVEWLEVVSEDEYKIQNRQVN